MRSTTARCSSVPSAERPASTTAKVFDSLRPPLLPSSECNMPLAIVSHRYTPGAEEMYARTTVADQVRPPAWPVAPGDHALFTRTALFYCTVVTPGSNDRHRQDAPQRFSYIGRTHCLSSQQQQQQEQQQLFTSLYVTGHSSEHTDRVCTPVFFHGWSLLRRSSAATFPAAQAFFSTYLATTNDARLYGERGSVCR